MRSGMIETSASARGSSGNGFFSLKRSRLSSSADSSSVAFIIVPTSGCRLAVRVIEATASAARTRSPS